MQNSSYWLVIRLVNKTCSPSLCTKWEVESMAGMVSLLVQNCSELETERGDAWNLMKFAGMITDPQQGETLLCKNGYDLSSHFYVSSEESIPSTVSAHYSCRKKILCSEKLTDRRPTWYLLLSIRCRIPIHPPKYARMWDSRRSHEEIRPVILCRSQTHTRRYRIPTPWMLRLCRMNRAHDNLFHRSHDKDRAEHDQSKRKQSTALTLNVILEFFCINLIVAMLFRPTSCGQCQSFLS